MLRRSLELRIPPLPATHVKGGARPSSTDLELHSRNRPALHCASSLATCDFVSQLLLGVHADHRLTASNEGVGPGVDVAELGVAVAMLAALVDLALAWSGYPSWCNSRSTERADTSKP